jgi:transposase
MIEELVEKLDKAIKRIDELEEKLAMTEGKLKIAEEKLAMTEHKLAMTEHKLAMTEHKLAMTEGKLAATEGKLAMTEGKLAATEGKLAATEEKLAATEEKLAMTEEKLAITERKLKIAEEKLNQNSFNSHLPPSKDSRKVIKQALPKSNKKNGGQVGHKGNTLKMVSQPDKIVKIKPELSVCSCGKNLSELEETISGRRQVFDLPPQKFDVTEYQTIQIKCSCGRCHVGNFPKHVQAPVQFGAGVQAASILLSTIGTPLNKIGFIFESLFGQKINDSTILKMLKNKSLETEYSKIYNQLSEEPVSCVDESSFLSCSTFQNKMVVVNGINQIILQPNLSMAFANVPQSHALSKMPMKNKKAIDFSVPLKMFLNFMLRDMNRSKLKTVTLEKSKLK